MYRLAQFDVTRRFASPATRLAAQIAFGLACTGAMLGFLMIIRQWLALSGPFIFIFPAVLIATLYGHWQAGLVALFASVGAMWYLVAPNAEALNFQETTPSARAVLALAIGAILLFLAESFRGTVARHAGARDREIERCEVLLRELEHRTRNNFSLVASLLEFQRRQSTSPEVRKALDQAVSRVHTFADAYSQFDTTSPEGTQVDMKSYLARLLDRVSDALFDGEVNIESDIAAMALPSKKAVAIGLYVNEALTNCAKYAFPEGEVGTISVTLRPEHGGWRLTVADNGLGDANGRSERTDGRSSGLGAALFQALAAQAGGTHEVTLPGTGRRLDLVSGG